MNQPATDGKRSVRRLPTLLAWAAFLLVPAWPERWPWMDNPFGSPHPLSYLIPPVLALLLGLALAWRFRRELLWRWPLRGFLAGVALLVGMGVLLCNMYWSPGVPPKAPGGPGHPLAAITLAAAPTTPTAPPAGGGFSSTPWIFWMLALLSVVGELWFRDLWFAQFPRRVWWSAGLNGLLSGGWYAAVIGQWCGVPATSDHGCQFVLLASGVAVLLIFLRWRGAALGTLALVGCALNLCVLTGVSDAGSGPHFPFGRALVLFAPAYASLLLALLVAPIGWRGGWRWRAWALFLPLFALAIAAAFWPLRFAKPAQVWYLGEDASAQARWQADLDYLAEEYPRRQLNFAALDRDGAFARDLARLRAQAGKIPDPAMGAGVTRLIARLGVAHSYVEYGHAKLVLRLAPLAMYWFSDGPAITDVWDDRLKELLGCRVLRIGGLSPAELEARLAPYVAHEEASWAREELRSLCQWTDLLQAEGLLASDGKLHLLVAKGAEAPHEVAVDGAGSSRFAEKFEYPALPFITGPGPHRACWPQDAPKTLYLRYDAVEDDPKSPAGPFARFVQETLARADREGTTRVVVDMRFNYGGDPQMLAPLIAGLQARPFFREPGHVRVLIGQGTFSAAVLGAAALQEGLGATLIGEPTSGLLSTYGETHWLTLPNTKLRVGYSTRWFTVNGGAAVPLRPDRLVRAASSADAAAGRDPIYQAAIDELSPAIASTPAASPSSTR